MARLLPRYYNGLMLGPFLWFILIFSPTKTFADELWLRVEEPIKVYKKRSSRSQIISQLKLGDRVAIDEKALRGWREVTIRINEQSRIGFIRNRDIVLSFVEKPPAISISAPMKRPAFGLKAYYSQLTQTSYTESLNQVEYNFSETKSSSLNFALLYDAPISSNWSFRSSLLYRQTSYSGEAHQESATFLPAIPTRRKQTMLGLSGDLKYFFKEAGRFYIFAGLEVSKSLQLELYYDQQKLNAENEDLPLFLITYAGLGYDFLFSQKWKFNPEVKFGLELNSNPTQIVNELALSIAYLL